MYNKIKTQNNINIYNDINMFCPIMVENNCEVREIKMINNWGDTEEDLQEKKFTVGVMLNFKSMCNLLQEMTEYIGEPNDKYPKNELIKMWINLMVIFLVLFSFTRAALMVITIPFCIFYGYVLVNLYQAWKNFKYSRLQFILGTIITLIIMLVISLFFGEYVLKF